jgi:hypothetical protein
MTNAAPQGKPDAGNPHVRFDEGGSRIMHRRSFASEGTLPKATRRERKRVRGNTEAWVSTLQEHV